MGKLKAFKIITQRAGMAIDQYSPKDQYIVFAESFGEAEDIYWKELGGKQEITNIILFENIVNVGYRITPKSMETYHVNILHHD